MDWHVLKSCMSVVDVVMLVHKLQVVLQLDNVQLNVIKQVAVCISLTILFLKYVEEKQHVVHNVNFQIVALVQMVLPLIRLLFTK